VYLYRPNGTTTVNGSLSSAHFSQKQAELLINNGTNPAPFLQDGGSGNLSIYSVGLSQWLYDQLCLGMPVLDFVTNPYTESFESSVFPPADGQIKIIERNISVSTGIHLAQSKLLAVLWFQADPNTTATMPPWPHRNIFPAWPWIFQTPQCMNIKQASGCIAIPV
jgi:hypothetical protein